MAKRVRGFTIYIVGSFYYLGKVKDEIDKYTDWDLKYCLILSEKDKE